MFLCHNVFSDVHVSFFHVVPVPILMLPFSIASTHPYTMTLTPLEAISTCVDVSWLTPGCYVIIGKIMKSGLFLSPAVRFCTKANSTHYWVFLWVLGSKVITGVKMSGKIISNIDAGFILVATKRRWTLSSFFSSVCIKSRVKPNANISRILIVKAKNNHWSAIPWIYKKLQCKHKMPKCSNSVFYFFQLFFKSFYSISIYCPL